MSQIVKRSALVPFAAEKMYALVADIESYPDFLNWCSAADVKSENEAEVLASVTINFKGLKKSFTTRNSMTENEKIEMSLVDGPFSHLTGEWVFTRLDDDSSKIELEMNFDFDSAIAARLVGPVFSYIANHQVDAFNRRAQEIYG